jgi:homeobox protein engrailed
MEENDPKPSEAVVAAEGQQQAESSPGGGSGGGGGSSSPADSDTSRRRALMLPAVLQAPGNHQHPHRITNFFIDNILRPEFGRRKDTGSCCASAGGGRSGGAGGESGAIGAEGGGGAGGAEQLLGAGARESRQNPPCAPGAGGSLPAGGGDSPGDGEGGSKTLSLHGGAKKSSDPGGPLDGALKARSLGGGDLSVSSDSDSSQASATLGAQPMLWPAWVYCTRYSDRPSSGEPGGPRVRARCGEAWGTGGDAGQGTYSEGRKKITRPFAHTHAKMHTIHMQGH